MRRLHGFPRCVLIFLLFSVFRFKKVRPAQQAAHDALDRGEFLVHNRLSSYEDKVVSVFHARDHRAKRFPQPAFDAIADDAVAKLFADRKSNVDRGLVGLNAGFGVNEHELPGRLGLAFAVYMAELFVPL